MSLITLQDIFQHANGITLPAALLSPKGPAIALNATIDGAITLAPPEWDIERYELQLPRRVVMPEHPMVVNRAYGGNQLFCEQLVRCPDNFLAAIHAPMFLNTIRDPVRMLKEMQRCLHVDGVVNISVPHYWAAYSHSFFARQVFSSTMWDDLLGRGWQFGINFHAIVGTCEANLSILSQLVKLPPRACSLTDMA